MLMNSSKKLEVWGALVSGFGSKQPLQQQSTPACFTGPVRSMMVLWNVCFLSIELSHFSPVRLNNYTGNIYFSEVFHVARGFLNQSDCKTFQTSILEKQLSYIKSLSYFFAWGYTSIGVTNQCSFCQGYAKVCPKLML